MIVSPWVNQHFTYPGEVRLPTLVEITEQNILQQPGSTTLDLAACFNSFPIPESMKPFYVFRASGRFYTLNVIATGQRQCPAAAHSLTASLAKRAAREASAETGMICIPHPYIDNVRFAGNRDVCDRAREIFSDLCAVVGLKLNPCHPWSSSYEFLGVKFDHNTKSVTISDKTRTKLSKIVEQWGSKDYISTLSMKDVLSCFGLIVWGSRVVHFPLGHFYQLIKFLRRRANRRLSEAAQFWPSILQSTLRSIRRIVDCPPRNALVDEEREFIIFCDASLEGYGVVWFDGTSTKVFSGVWENDLETDIQVLESEAALIATEILPKNESQGRIRVLLFIDNTSVVGSLKKTHSRNFQVNTNVTKALGNLRENNYTACIRWIRSEFNISDAPSRGFE